MGKYTPPPLLGIDSNHPVKSRNRRKLVFLCFASVLVLVIASLGWYAFRITQRASTICSEPILKEASNALNPLQEEQAQQDQLKPVYEKVKQTPNYEKDPNCLYIVTSYYVLVADIVSSKASMNKLNKVYDPKAGLSKTLGYDDPLASLRLKVQLLENRLEQGRNNARELSQ